jgi:7-keto-8-aminopelargonate synthetase-like enzyme
MAASSDLLDACDVVGGLAREHGIGLLEAEDERLDGRSVRVGGRRLLQFCSCSYLGLELDPRLVEGAIDAARRFGTQFSVSRAFLSAPPYAELEARLDALTGGFCVVTPNTTLASAAALPSLVREGDAVLLDHQVHMTVQQAVPLLQRLGAAVELVRHGALERVEARLRELRGRHPRVWLLLDGVYSMHGDLAPIEALAWLLGRYEQLHLYVDDAHGTSWTGRHGRGHALEHLRGAERERAVVALSLNKSFGAGGGCLVLPDEAARRRVRHTAGPLLFTGPLQPPTLGAALASARVHASPELERLQAELGERIGHANARCRELGLPLLFPHERVPIRFVGLGPRAASVAMARHLRERGLLASCALFPAVPAHQTGIRFTLTRHHALEDVDRLLEEMAHFLPRALAAGGVTRAEVERSFGLAPARPHGRPLPGAGALRGERAVPGDALRCDHAESVDAFGADEWERLLGARGFGASFLRWLERTFGPHQKPESHWGLHYFRVADGSGRPLLATFFTLASLKDDMFAAPAVSRSIEARRREEPGYLVSRVLGMGSPLSEGDALFLDRSGAWRGALALLAAQLSDLAESAGASLVVLRDLPADDAALDAALLELGFAELPAPDSFELEIAWRSREEYLAGLGRRARRFQQRRVEPLADLYEARVLCGGERRPDWFWAHLHGLYLEVWRRSFRINTFALPEDFLPRMLEHEGFEIVTLARRTRAPGAGEPAPEAFFAAHRGRAHYLALVLGLAREAARHGAYPLCLATAIERAASLGLRRVRLGMGAPLEKRRFGAHAVPRKVWFQARDHFHADVLALLAGDRPLPGAADGSGTERSRGRSRGEPER